MNVEDLELLRLSSLGDAGAFETFLERHKDPVMGFLVALTDDKSGAEDAFQETFISAWKSAATFRAEGSARSWLFSIARRSVGRLNRRRAGEPAALESLDDLALRAGWRTEDERSSFLDRLANRELVDGALANLSPDECEVLMLRDVQGFSGREVADILGISLQATKSRLHRARLSFVANVRKVIDAD